MQFMKTNLAIAIAAGSILAACPTHADPIISVDLLNASGQAITGSYGIAGLGTVVSGWNNPIKLYSLANLSYSDGTSSTVSYSLTDSSGSYSSFNAAYAGTPLAGGPATYGTPTTLTLNNLNANFANGYWLLVYVGGYNANTGSSISDGATTYFYRPDPAPTNPYGAFVQTTQTTDPGVGNEPVAQYAVFGSSSSPLASDSLTLTFSTVSGAAGGGAIGGFQIIGAPAPVPEPASSAVVALGGLGLLVGAQRRRRK
jgi:hypothetical protein